MRQHDLHVLPVVFFDNDLVAFGVVIWYNKQEMKRNIEDSIRLRSCRGGDAVLNLHLTHVLPGNC